MMRGTLLALAVVIASGCGASERAGTTAGAEIDGAEKEKVASFWHLYREAVEQARQGQIDQAIESYRRVLEIRPTHEDSSYALGNLLAQRGDFTPALAAFDGLLRANPLSPRGHYQVAALRSSCEPGAPVNFDQARWHIEQGMRINPEESGPYYDLGHLALLCGDEARAEEELERAVRRNPKGYLASYDLALLARQRGDPSRAAALALRAIEQCRGDLPIAGVLGEGDTEATKARFHPESPKSIALLAALIRASRANGGYADAVPAPLRVPQSLAVEPASAGAWFAAPVDASRAGGGAVAVDLDRDHDLDVVVSGFHSQASVLRNDAGTLREEPLVVAGAVAPRAWDVVLLSRTDEPALLYFVGGGWGEHENHLLRAREDGAFDDVTHPFGLGGTRATQCACVLDVDGDGRLDLIEGLATRHDALAVYLRDGDSFRRAPGEDLGGPVTHLAPRGSDLLVARGTAPLALVHLDRSGHAQDRTAGSGLERASGWVAAWVDIDRDGIDDVFAPGAPSYERALARSLGLASEPPRVVFHRGRADGSFAAATDLAVRLGLVLDVAVLDRAAPALYLACGGLRLDHEEQDVILSLDAEHRPLLVAAVAPEPWPGKTVHVLSADLNGDGEADLYLSRSGFYPGDRRADRVLRASTER